MAERRSVTRWTIAAVALLTVGWPAPAGTQEMTTAAPHRLIVLDPVSDLVHDDPLRVQVTGLAPGASVAVAQCEPGGIVLDDNCDGYRFLRADPWGVAQAALEADVILDTTHGPVDCRTVVCRIVTLFSGDGTTRRVNLQYDPTGPDPERPVVQVTPTTDLVDGQTVEITGDGIPTDLIESRRVWIRQCVLPASSLTHCDNEQLDVPAGSPVDATFEVEALLQPWGESHDCRADDCVLWVGSRREGSQSALIPLDFDPLSPIAAPPSITVTPSTDLDDGQQVAVDGEGFDDASLGVRQCPASSTEEHDCDLTVRHQPTVAGDGTFAEDLSVRAVLRLADGTTVDCRVEACVLLVGGFHGEVTTAPLTFDPATQVLQPDVTLVGGSGLAEIDDVQLLGSGYPEGPNRITFYQCVGAPSPDRVASHCWRGVRLDRTIEDTYDLTYTVRRRMRAPAVGIVDCRIYRCKVWVAELGNAGVVGTTRLRFD